MPTLASFLNLTLGVCLLILATYGLRWLWVRAIPPRILAYMIAPGVAVHELSHAAACVVTGAKVHSMVLFRSDGSGEVKHGPPKIKYFGDVLISLAPLIGCTLCLVLLGVVLRAPVNFWSVKAEGVQPNQLVFVADLATLVWYDLVSFFKASALLDWRTWVFLYFAMCFTMGMAPSRQDLKNGSVGILVICGLVLVLHLIVDRLLKAEGDGPIFEFIGSAIIKLHYPFAICALSLLLCGLVYLVGMPFRQLKRRR
ncbi:MAG: M50 family metallopeptidase [Planctomycetes bacterium]|nr:M50 family metallopeptidase [Planctomycetota bacterium]